MAILKNSLQLHMLKVFFQYSESDEILNLNRKLNWHNIFIVRNRLLKREFAVELKLLSFLALYHIE